MKQFFNVFVFSIILFTTTTPLFAFDFSVKTVAGYRISDSNAIQKYYKEAEGELLWVKNGQLTSEAKNIIHDIGDSWEHGLNPVNYRYAALSEYAKNGVPQGREDEIELLMSDSIIRYSQDISGMRIPPREIDADTRSWSRGVDAYALLKILAEQQNPSYFIQQLFPQDATYERLKDELVKLSDDLTKNPEKNIKRKKFPGLLRPGTKNPAIVSIRQQLGLSGQSDVYDESLKEEVQDFQARHGLAADGLIGPRSFDAISQTRTQKLIKLIANLERRRWVRRPMPLRYIAVNIPQMHLEAVDSGEVQFDMPVIIGRDKRPTMSFVDDIIGIRFNPSWYVPDTIKAEDYLPKLQQDPNSLADHGINFRVKTETGYKQVASTDIDWKTMTVEGLKDIQMFQESGEENALGLIRILMPNKYDIYLHDTNAPELFAKDDRALSSGCVRVSEPRRIANFILGMNKGWNDKKIDAYIATHKLIEIPAQYHMPVYLFYFTAWVDDKDRIIIANDIYKEDVKLVQALQAKGKIPFELGIIQ